MNILLINNSTTLKDGGGPTRCVLLAKQMLEAHGHRVAVFSTGWASISPEYYLIPPLDMKLVKSKNIFKKIKAGVYSIYNPIAKSRIEQCINDFKPHIAHCHNIYNHITPSILPQLASHGIPVVMTAHDLKLVCPNHMMFAEGALCERCKFHRYYNAFLHRCFLNSRQASLVGSCEAYIHYFKKYFLKYIDVVISPSRFLENKLLEWKFPRQKLRVLNNFTAIKPFAPASENNTVLYFGMIIEVKGIRTLLDAATLLKNRCKFLIAGEDKIKLTSSNLPLGVSIRSFPDDDALNKLIRESSFSVLPSLNYENQPSVILEAFACGRPVIASDIGGIPEIVLDGKNGLLFTPGNAGELAQKIDWLLGHPKEAEEMGQNGREMIKSSFSQEEHYTKLIKIYEDLL